MTKKPRPRLREIALTVRMIKKDKLTLVAIGVIVSFYIIAISAPWLATNPYALDTGNRLAALSGTHPLGTDDVGRDVLSLLIIGTQTSVYVGVVIVALVVIIGVPVGAVAGYLGGKFDELLMRITDMFMSFPDLLLAMVFAFSLGRGIIAAVVGISLVFWTQNARLVRSTVILEKEKEYVTAARVLGKSGFRILFGEILPNSIHPVICSAALLMGNAIIEVAALSFLGVGIQPPLVDWGVMIARGRNYLLGQPMMSIVPGILIMLNVFSYNLVADSLRDALDPHLRREL